MPLDVLVVYETPRRMKYEFVESLWERVLGTSGNENLHLGDHLVRACQTDSGFEQAERDEIAVRLTQESRSADVEQVLQARQVVS
jgi:hypothetical protein